MANDNLHQHLTEDQWNKLRELAQGLTYRQADWLSGFFTGFGFATSPVHSLVEPGLSNQTSISRDTVHTPVASIQQNEIQASSELPPRVTILYGTRTGNSEIVAKQAKAEAEARGIVVNLVDMNNYKPRNIKDEKNLLVVVSTHGEGVPPTSAEELYNYIHSNKAPSLKGVRFSVLALGDSSYVYFCKTGREFDQKLEELGAERLYPRVDCDIDFEEKASGWVKGVVSCLSTQVSTPSLSKLESIIQHQEKQSFQYNKRNPFRAQLIDKILLSGRGSTKETYHFELSIENSGITYEPGDTCGVYGINSDRSVNELLQTTRLSGSDIVEYDNEKISLQEVLTNNLEISALSGDTLRRYNEFARNENINNLLENPELLKQYLYGRDVVDLLTDFPVPLQSQQLVDSLRKIAPRLYSISSSLLAHPNEIHLTVGAVRFNNGRYKEGICSTFLSDRLKENSAVRVFIEKNPEFKLPKDGNTPIIMVGPGTGIAPFRSFVEERIELGSKGKNWLFFGDRNFTTDFLYQAEWQDYLKKGALTRLNVAFSRDTSQKVYVQHKMLEHGQELYDWLEQGGHFYVCGDMKNMWNDVNHTLLDIISKYGNHSVEGAEEYLQRMKREKRYQVDVY